MLCGYVGFAEVTEQYLKAESSSPSPPSPSPSQQPLPLPSQFADRIRVFGENQIPPPKRKTFLRLLWDAYNDKIMILLTIAAVISLSLGVYEAASGQSQVDWIEGVAICVAILIVVAATAGNDWQKERQFAKLNRRVFILPPLSIFGKVMEGKWLTGAESRPRRNGNPLRKTNHTSCL